MGLFSPKLPPFDLHIWYWGRRSERFKPLCRHWGEHGHGAPWSMYFGYLLKIALYLGGGLAFILSTPSTSTLSQIGSWWTDPVVYQKAVLWSVLFEVLGFGCGFGPVSMHFLPPLGGLLHWLRPGTIRLPPWPSRVPLTKGTRRTGFDVLLYAAVLGSLIWPLLSAASKLDFSLSARIGVLEPSHLLPFAVLLPVLGLRDKTIFLAARSEYYWVTALAFFMPYLDMIVTIKILVVLVWWAAASSKMNKIFPYTLAAILSTAPWPPKFLRRRLFRKFPHDMRPSALTSTSAYLVVLVELAAPLVLLISTDRFVTVCAAVVMVLLHLNVVAAMPAGAPMEWNVFIIFSTGYLFYGHFPNNMGTALHPLAPALLAIPVVAMVTWGNLRPDQVSHLMSMRYFGGNWATSMWALKRSAVAKMNSHVIKSSQFPKQQLKRLFGEQVGEVMSHKYYTWRALQHQGRALFGLLPRVAGPKHERAIVMDGELAASTLLGWSFSDGHLHNEQLIAAVQQRCNFEPGELRVVILEAAAFGSDRQDYRLVDGATGTFERGYVRIKDLLDRQPWEIDDLPAYVLRRLTDVPGDEASTDPGYETPATGTPRISPDAESGPIPTNQVDQPDEFIRPIATTGQPEEPVWHNARAGRPGDSTADSGSIGPQDFRPLGVAQPNQGSSVYQPSLNWRAPATPDPDELAEPDRPQSPSQHDHSVRHAGTG